MSISSTITILEVAANKDFRKELSMFCSVFEFFFCHMAVMAASRAEGGLVFFYRLPYGVWCRTCDYAL